MPKLLEGRVAVVTGAGNGIGRAEVIPQTLTKGRSREKFPNVMANL